MAISVYTSKPKTLLRKIKAAINDSKIETWEYDSDGDFTHTPDQWWEKAWFRPFVNSGLLRFNLVGLDNTRMTKSTYGIYHGRFIEILLTHFRSDFVTISYREKAKH